MSFFDAVKSFYEEHIKSRLTSRVALLFVTGLCLAALFIQYFRRSDAVPFTEVVGTVIVPFQRGVNQVGSFLFSTEQERRTLQEANRRIRELEEELAALKNENEVLQGLGSENEELRKLLDAKERLTYTSVEAEVIGNDGVNYFERFTINKGTLDGIRVNMNVVNQDGLVGLVTETGLNYAVVTAIVENGVNVSAMTRNGHENCIVSGSLAESGRNRLVLKNALLDVDLEGDNTLVTSNISDKYLPGILIGYAYDV